ncbi:DUF3027 domain-containing protein [Georgenia sp. AZ-5]|uniref:DUF3027 domain-containing protein n=1 Tax=Georgenia sp. AZ-5 TaxID=3367526 RepID=UPI003754BEF1
MPAATTSRTTTRPGKEPVLAGAVDLARRAAEEMAQPGQVGEHRGVVVEGERLLTHVFEAHVPGYRGWHWAVTVARPPRGRSATVCEVELLPGEGALLAPQWVPWSERLRPGDVGPSDVLPYVADDPRLEQGYEATGEDADELAIYELGLGRARVLSAEGRAQATTRWYEGDHGPNAPSAKAAKAPCSTCGFFMKLAGSPRTVFGVCANEWSPDDGRVVSVDHGCGAHSETDAPHPQSLWNPSEPVVNERDLEVLDTHPAPPEVVETPLPVAAVAGQAPVETPAVDDAPVETPAAEEAPVETPAAEEAPVETPAVDHAPVETAAAEEAPVETPAVDDAPVETPVAGEPSAEPPVAEKDTAEPADVPAQVTGEVAAEDGVGAVADVDAGDAALNADAGSDAAGAGTDAPGDAGGAADQAEGERPAGR